MKKLLILLSLILLIILLVSCQSVSNLVPKVLAADTQSVVKQVEANTDDVFSEIQRNIDLVSNLKTQLLQAQANGKTLDINDVISKLQVVSDSYSKLSGEHQAINTGLLKKIANIGNMEDSVNDEIAALKQRAADYSNQLVAVNDADPAIAKSRKQALSQAINYVQKQEALWTQFNSIEGNISAEMTNLQSTLNEFLNAIDSSALVFKEGLNLLTLQRDIDNALALFTQDEPRMAQLSNDMQQSWNYLDTLVAALTSISSVNIAK